MSQQEDLIQLGLSRREAEAYLTLLQLGEAKIGEISEKTKESRSHLYETIKSLIRKGLVSHAIKNRTQYFSAAPPEKIIDYIQEKEALALHLLPQLHQIKDDGSSRVRVGIYEGVEGMKTILHDIIRTKQEWLAIGSAGGVPFVLHEFSIEKFHLDRIKNKVKLKVLVQDTPAGRKRAKAFRKYPLIELEYLPKTYQNPTTIYTYGSKTALLMWLTHGKPFAILIESPEIAKSFRAFFHLLWNQH